MNFTIEKKDRHAVVTSNVEKLDGAVSPMLKSEFVMANAEGIKNIVFDISHTRYCDSSGLSAILVGNRLCKNSGGSFVLCGVQDGVMKLITISQLDSILNITLTVAEASEKVLLEDVERKIE